MIVPTRWTSAQLDDDRLAAVELFRQERMAEPLEAYLEAFDEVRGQVEDLLEMTVDLREIEHLTLEALSDQGVLDSFRYLAGPPISLDDLKALMNAKSLSLRALKDDPDLVPRLVQTVFAGLDRRRFPWVMQRRDPDEGERKAAIIASAALIAAQRVATTRRNEGKTQQEARVRNALFELGFTQVPRPGGSKGIENVRSAPKEGQFCNEVKLGPRKADLVVGLWDGRTMGIECKVSNSFVNSIKRLNKEAAIAAKEWLQAFGENQMVPVAVLSGLYELDKLEQAQRAGLTLYWAHRLSDLTDWIERTRS